MKKYILTLVAIVTVFYIGCDDKGCKNGNVNSLDMVQVKGGTFTMGCTPEQSNDCDSDENPAHKVTLSDFSIGKYEVTQKLWKEVMDANPSEFKGDDLPVESISWEEVQTFILMLNKKTGKKYRLPTEAEWEYAARGGNNSKGYKYSGGNDVAHVAWYDGNSGGTTHSVGTKEPNELGIYDMSGNVWEWVNDWHDKNYYGSSPEANPGGPSSGFLRVLRGGVWHDFAQHCRVANRFGNAPGDRYISFGFRLALSP